MFHGRIDRKGFAKGFVVINIPVLIVTVFSAVATNIFHTNAREIAFNNGIVVFWISMATLILIGVYFLFYWLALVGLAIRRFHDMGQPGWFSIVYFVSGVNLVVGIFQIVWPGENVQNEYGMPESPRKLKDIFFGDTKNRSV